MRNKDNFPKKLKLLRESLKMNQKEFSESIEVTQATLSAYELGKQVPSASVLLNIALKYDVSIDWLFENEESDKDKLTISTYKDMFDIIIQLMPYFSIGTSNVDPKGNEVEPYFYLRPYSGLTDIFLASLDDMVELLIDKTISPFVFEAWKKEKLKEYENVLCEKGMDFEKFVK